MHPEALPSTLALTSVKRKRAAETSTQVQSTLRNQWSIFPQGSLDKAVMKYIITGLQPFSLIEQESFKIFIIVLLRFRNKDEEGLLTDKMREVAHIATTQTVGQLGGRGFIGVTAHWINEDLNRWAFLSSHNHHGQWFKLHKKRSESASESEEQDDHTDEESGDDVKVENVDVADLLSQDDGMEFQLPRHQRCACHLINRIVMADALKARWNDTYKKVYRSAFSKCHALWNKCGRSTLAAEAVEDACSLQLLRIKTRFGTMAKDPELIAAAILLPKFRTTWTKEEHPILAEIEILNFFILNLRNGLHQTLNTPLPASAACERLFSIAGLVFAPRRARLNSKNFENQLLLRMNRKFLNW
uniref:HAT C-terminal dimerisation domain-containing protein n=1 Tax=Amphiprion percula TaxID=161767 RepID=A0A3P8ST58_AMPPE